jgi:hypothetical protein
VTDGNDPSFAEQQELACWLLVICPFLIGTIGAAFQ